MAERKSKYRIISMDINPFVFSTNGDFIAVDGFAEFRTAEEDTTPNIRPDTSGLKGFFEPKGIVVAGVSHDMKKYSLARNVVQLLCDLGRRDIYCTNPKGGEVEISGKRFRLYKSLDEIPQPFDLVVYAAPAQYTLEFSRGVPDNKSVVLISGLPSDINYAAFCQDIRQHKARVLRFVGPNCMGIFFAPEMKNSRASIPCLSARKGSRWAIMKGATVPFSPRAAPWPSPRLREPRITPFLRPS
jgi:predicted CoA-binding protein